MRWVSGFPGAGCRRGRKAVRVVERHCGDDRRGSDPEHTTYTFLWKTQMSKNGSHVPFSVKASSPQCHLDGLGGQETSRA